MNIVNTRQIKNGIVIATLFAAAAYMQTHGQSDAAGCFSVVALLGWIFA